MYLKNVMGNYNFVTEIASGDENNHFDVFYEDDNLCFLYENYQPDNSFYIFKDNVLYLPMKNLFKQIRKHDKFCYVSRNKLMTKFEWISDGNILDATNRLLIVETIDGYRIQFVKRINNNIPCIVKFSLTNSKNQNITNAVDEMVIQSMQLNKVVKK